MRNRILLFFKVIGPQKCPGEGSQKWGFSIFDQIATKIDIVISPDKRSIPDDFHDDRYMLGPVGAKKPHKIVYFEMF